MRLANAKLRPDEVSKWMAARSYRLDRIPFISDVGSYYTKWTMWWTSCQPAWRQNSGWPLPRIGPSAANWSIKFGARGQNGLFLIVMSTAWWASSVQSEEDRVKFDEAVEDVRWVIDQAIESHKALPAPVPPQHSDTPQESVPAPGASWMSRADGKRQPKPSRRLLEGGGI